MTDHQPALIALLDYLASTRQQPASVWRDWTITPVRGGANNLVQRVASPLGDFAVKWTIRDERDRAGREYAALLALQQAGLALAPLPMLLERDRYAQPVIVQAWLHGKPLDAPPQTAFEWHALVKHYVIIHRITPTVCRVSLPEAWINAASVGAGRAMIEREVSRLPTAAQPTCLIQLLARFARWPSPEWSPAPQALCRVDANYRNFIRQPTGLVSVDWENSGWGDPAFEIAEMITHPAYHTVSTAEWQAVIGMYSEQMDDPNAPLRITTYRTMMLVWWVARLARSLHEIPQGQDERLVARPASWLTETKAKYEQYLAMALARVG